MLVQAVGEAIDDRFPSFSVADVGVEWLKACFEVGVDGGQTVVVCLEVALLEAEVFESMEYGGIDEMAQAFSVVNFEGGDHVDFADHPVFEGFAPGAGAGNWPAVTGGEEEAFGMEPGVVD